LGTVEHEANRPLLAEKHSDRQKHQQNRRTKASREESSKDARQLRDAGKEDEVVSSVHYPPFFVNGGAYRGAASYEGPKNGETGVKMAEMMCTCPPEGIHLASHTRRTGYSEQPQTRVYARSQ
jgi:hypothetical protein